MRSSSLRSSTVRRADAARRRRMSAAFAICMACGAREVSALHMVCSRAVSTRLLRMGGGVGARGLGLHGRRR